MSNAAGVDCLDIGKPHIRSNYATPLWSCHGFGLIGVGNTPIAAYDHWAISADCSNNRQKDVPQNDTK